MNANEMKVIARDTTAALFTDVFAANDAIQFADGSWAIRQVVDNQEIWTAVTIQSKAYKATARFDAFNPYTAAEEWTAEKEVKAQEKKKKEEEKAEKIARDNAKRAAQAE